MKFVRAVLAMLALAFAPAAFAAGDLVVVNIPANIASGQSLSNAIDLGPNRLFAVSMPSGWTSAGITFQASVDGSNYSNLFDDTGTEVSLTVSASQYVVLASPVKWMGIRWIKLRSGTSSSPITQSSAVTVSVVGVP